MPWVNDYLEFLEGRCRPNTVLAAAYDLRVFFGVVAKPAEEVRSADVLAFITAQRTGRTRTEPLQRVREDDSAVGVSTSTVARRLSIISGFFGYLQARGDIIANPVPRGLPTRRERSRPGQGVPLTRRTRRLPRILTPTEVDKLTAALRTHRDRAMVAAMVFGGLRRCEVLELRLEDLRVAERRVFIAEGKGGHQRLMLVSARLFTAVAASLDGHPARAPTGCSWSSRKPTAATRCRPREWTRCCSARGAARAWSTTRLRQADNLRNYKHAADNQHDRLRDLEPGQNRAHERCSRRGDRSN